MKPLDIRQVGPEELLIIWEDQHRSLYPCRYLRLKCRCAQCMDEWSGRSIVEDRHIPAGIRLVNWQPVGNYALRFLWSDGHQTGIYTSKLLRDLCLCSQCLGIENTEDSGPHEKK